MVSQSEYFRLDSQAGMIMPTFVETSKQKPMWLFF